MLCNGLYGDNTFSIDDQSFDKVKNWCEFYPEKLSDLSNPTCYEPMIYAYLRADKSHHVKFIDNYSNDDCFLSWESMTEAMSKLAQEYPHHMNDLLQENDDFYTAYTWLQIALLGEDLYC